MTEQEWLNYRSVWEVDLPSLLRGSDRKSSHLLFSLVPLLWDAPLCERCQHSLAFVGQFADDVNLRYQEFCKQNKQPSTTTGCLTHEAAKLARHYADGNITLVEAWNNLFYDWFYQRRKQAGMAPPPTVPAFLGAPIPTEYQFLLHGPGPATALAVLRDIVGNPFRLMSSNPSWQQESTVQRLAQTIYAENDFTGLPILADALEDAGCSETDLLEHLRSPGPHVRGCWAVDLILGKQ